MTGMVPASLTDERPRHAKRPPSGSVRHATQGGAVPEGGLEPPRPKAPDPKSGVAAVSPLRPVGAGLCESRASQQSFPRATGLPAVERLGGGWVTVVPSTAAQRGEVGGRPPRSYARGGASITHPACQQMDAQANAAAAAARSRGLAAVSPRAGGSTGQTSDGRARPSAASRARLPEARAGSLSALGENHHAARRPGEGRAVSGIGTGVPPLTSRAVPRVGFEPTLCEF
jgi:hypothetical protein